MLSIITVVYNDAEGLKKTLSSVINNSNSLVAKNVEYVVVDGASSDETVDVIKGNSNIIDAFISEKDTGIYDAMNRGLHLAKGDWIYFLNAGDTLDGDAVSLALLNEIDNVSNDVNMFYGSYRADGIRMEQVCSLPFLISHMLNHQSMIYHRSLLKHGYDIRYRFCADYAHLLSVWPRLKPKALDLCIANFDTTGVSSQASNKARMWQERLQAVWRSDLNFFKKILLSSRGFIAWPYHVIKIKFNKVR